MTHLTRLSPLVRSTIRVPGLLLTLLLSTATLGCESANECLPGAASCVCAPASRCDDGLVCTDGLCAAPEERALSVPSAARACEVLLRDGAGGEVTGVRFAEGVTGAHVREAPRTALSFASTPQNAIGTVSVQFLGGAGAFEIESSRCFDAAGSALADGVRAN